MWDTGDIAGELTGIKQSAVVCKGWCLLVKQEQQSRLLQQKAKKSKIKGRSEHKEH